MILDKMLADVFNYRSTLKLLVHLFEGIERDADEYCARSYILGIWASENVINKCYPRSTHEWKMTQRRQVRKSNYTLVPEVDTLSRSSEEFLNNC
jgi:hypothetical protein